jgi:hypothetical protein
MKAGSLIISIIVILALVCSPALSISKSDLLSQYKIGQFPGPTTPIPNPTQTHQVPSWYIAPTPTPINNAHPVGSISVTSAPIGAVIYLDGSFRGFTPMTILGVSPTYGYFDSRGYITNRIGDHPHQIKLTKIGYQEYTISDILVPEGKITTVSAALTPISTPKTPTNIPIPQPTQITTGTGTGTLSVRSTPPGAPVIIDGVHKGMTPVTIKGVSAGVHQVSVTLNGNELHSTWVRILPRNWGVVTVDVTENGEAVGFAILEGQG